MSPIDFLYKTTEAYEEMSSLYKVSYIKKLPNGKFRVFSSKGKNLGTYSSKKAAQKRLKQVEYFKYLKKKAEKEVDLTKIEDFSYSSIMRKINKQLGLKGCRHFAELYKKHFDQLLLDKEKNIEEKSLAEAVSQFNEKYPLKIKQKITKSAAANIGSEAVVARYLANIIKFILGKISAEKRPNSLYRVKGKISKLDINEISNKKMPASSAMGQSITFVKHTLFGQSPQYIKNVINYILRYL